MAQPAGIFMQDNWTKLGIPVFWVTVKSDSLWQFNIWIEQFLMVMTVKENIIPHPNPKNVIEEPLPRPESPGTGEDMEAKAAGELGNKLALEKCAQETEENKPETLSLEEVLKE